MALQQVQSRLEKLETASTNVTRWNAEQRPPRRVSDRTRDQVGRCKQPGHYARGCASRRNQGDNDIEQNAPVTSINNITSYFVCARVLGAPVAFLVDTGAGVSLLNGSIWDKCKSSEIKLEPGVYQNLVGVDGHPIRVRGSVTVPVSIAGRSFQQQFIIADHITAEGILGVDFMERNNCVVDLAKRQMTVEKCIAIPLASNAPCYNMNATASNVFIKETCTIPPESEVEVMVQISSGSGTYLVEGNQLKQSGVLVARAIVTPKNNTVPIRIANTSALPVTVFKGMKIGRVELIDHEEVSINAVETSSLNETPQWPHDGLQLSLPEELTEVQRDKFAALLSLYSDVVAINDKQLGRTDILSHKIDTGDATPIRQQARRVPLPQREKVKELLKDMMKKEVISPSKSPWASPVVLVTKKDGSTRFCIDYRKVNDVTRKDAYPIPRVDDTLDTLAGSTWFSMLDLKNGYWQVEVAEEHREKTAFCTQEGLFEFNVIPFGLCNSPATFQRLMNAVLAGLQWTSCLVYIDDIIVVGSTFDQHLSNLQKVFERLKQAGLKLQPQKCHFFQRQVQFLGHVISQDGISPDPEKTSKVAQWPVPTLTVEVQQFLGLANYYRRFVKDFASKAKPLHQLTVKKLPFIWTADCQKSFDNLKQCLTTAPILAMPIWSKPFIIDTDACDSGIGAVLSQIDENGMEHVVCYASRILTKAERNYCVTRKELLAVVTFLQYFRQYLLGRSFTLRIDHGALAWLQNFRNPEGQLARWLEKLQEYQFTIIHRPGRKHSNADALSRLPCRQCGKNSHYDDASIGALVSKDTVCGYSIQDLRNMQLADGCIGQLLIAKEQDKQPSLNFAKTRPVAYRRLFQQWDQLIISNGVCRKLG